MPASRLACRLTGGAAAKPAAEPPSQGGHCRSKSCGAKERQAGDPQTAGLQADYPLGLDPDRGRSLGRMPAYLLPGMPGGGWIGAGERRWR
jgi:hypothetical protein